MNAGSYVATGTFAGNDNYTEASNTATIVIAKATPTVTVHPVSATFDGQAHGTTGTVAGVGGADLGAATISYNTTDGQAPVNAGSYVATGTFAGNDNYTAASGDAPITLNRASSTTLVTFEAGPYTYRRSAFTATAAVTGAGGLNQVVPVVYSGDCVNVSVAGCTATATFAGDANHDGDADIKSIQILKKALTITANDATKILGATLTFAGIRIHRGRSRQRRHHRDRDPDEHRCGGRSSRRLLPDPGDRRDRGGRGELRHHIC